MGPRFRSRSVLTGVKAGEAMQRAFPRIWPDRGLDEVIRQMIRSREDAVLVTDAGAAGVVTKTDLMAAFYGGLPLETPAGELMAGPVETCCETDGLDTVLDRMTRKGIHQIFVTAEVAGPFLGKISHDDVAGLIYRLCRNCRQGRRGNRDGDLPKLLVREVMTIEVQRCGPDQTLYEVMDMLSERQVRSLPVVDDRGQAMGVISKTDLIFAYSRGKSPESPAGGIMRSPVITGAPKDALSAALTAMLLGDIRHLFVTDGEPGRITRVVSLSDAARFRSGTCRACSPSRNF